MDSSVKNYNYYNLVFLYEGIFWKPSEGKRKKHISNIKLKKFYLKKKNWKAKEPVCSLSLVPWGLVVEKVWNVVMRLVAGSLAGGQTVLYLVQSVLHCPHYRTEARGPADTV